MSGKIPPPNDHSGREQCAFYDDGSKEEHRPHQSLQECTAQHPRCEERCFIYYQKCTVEGSRIETTRVDGKLIDKEVKETYLGSHRDRDRALEIARHQCETDYPYNRSCHIVGCSEDYERSR
jgi:hypothetical protein